MRRLRVLHLTTNGAPIGGAERLLLDAIKQANPDRWELHLCTLGPRGTLHEELATRCSAHSLEIQGYRSVPAGLQRLRRLNASLRPDILHTHLSHATLLGAAVAAVDSKTCLVQTRHYSDYVARFRPRRLYLDAWAARRCDRVIAVSEAARKHLCTREHVDPDRIVVIDNGVDWDTLSALDPAHGRARLAELGVRGGPVIGCAASFDITKGHPYLLRALKSVLPRYPELSLALFGAGAYEAAIRAETERLGLGANVHFLGHRADVHTLLPGLDVYVQPSIEEGFGLALIEAMATRRPVIASAIGGMLDTVVPNETGVHVAPADPDALARAILGLLDDPSRAKQLGERACARVREHYSLSTMLASYDAVYRQALGEKSPPTS